MTVSQARQLLGVPPGADGQVVARAFREAVKTAHPDRPGGDDERFRQVIEAHRLLKSMDFAPLNFSLARRPSQQSRRRTAPRSQNLLISIHEALYGGECAIDAAGGRRLSVRLPPGLRANDTLKLSGAEDGVDLLLRIAVAAEPGLSIQGHDLWMDVDVSSRMGRSPYIEVDTPRGRRAFIMPKDLSACSLIRFKGQGLPARGSHPAGDLIVNLTVHESLSRTLLRRFSARWAA
jgi:curved DNA-binding protein